MRKFLSVLFFLIFCLSDCDAKKFLVETEHFSFIVESVTSTAMLLNVRDNVVNDSVSVPEFVKYGDDNCNVVVINQDAFENVLGKVKSVVLPKYLIKHEQNTKVIEMLLDKDIELIQDNQIINRIEDFGPFPKLGKLGWEREEDCRADILLNTESEWQNLNKFMNGYIIEKNYS